MATISISQLDTATQAKVDDLYEVAVVDENSQTGYASRNLTAAQIATLIAQGVQFSGLSTEAKTIIAAINEAAQNGGSEVEPNPAGEPTDTLEKIGINGTVYEVGGSEPVSKTATGNPIHIEDAADAPIVSGVVTFEPVQDLHGYTKPWAGGAGKNKFDKDNADILKGYALNSETGLTYPATVWSTSNYIHIEPATTYTLNTIDGVSNSMVFYDSEKAYISGATAFGTKTTPSNAKYLRFDYKTEHSDIIQLELGSQTTSYEPYSNICPIEGYTDCEIDVTGKNLLPSVLADIKANNTEGTWSGNVYTYNGIVYTVNTDDGENVTNIKANGQTSNNDSRIRLYVGDGTAFANNTLNGNVNSSGDGIIVQNATESPYTIYAAASTSSDVIIDDCTDKTVSVYFKVGANSSVNNATIQPMIRLATETDPTFEPYQSKTYTIDLDGTRYGGKVNLASGEMMVDRGYVTCNGTENWSAPDSTWTNQYLFQCVDLIPLAKKMIGYTVNANLITDKVVCTMPNVLSETNLMAGIAQGGYASRQYFYVCFGIEQTLDEFKNYLANNNLQICYELSIPFTVQLTPEQIRTLEGTNNISTNMTDMSLEYITESYQPLVELIERSAGHHYSTQERVVGTWIDGKPLYEKTYIWSETLSGQFYKEIDLDNPDIVFIRDGWYSTSSGETAPIPYTHPTSTYNIGVYINSAKNQLEVRCGSAMTMTALSVTFRYTKATD